VRRLWISTFVLVAIFAQSPKAMSDRADAREFVRLGLLKAAEGRPAEAVERYQQAIRSDPDFARSYELALPIWLRLGKVTLARESLEQLTLRCRHCLFAWYALGAVYRRSGRYDLAVLAYDAYLSRKPRDPDAVFGMAMALQASSDDRAEMMLERYISLEGRPERQAYREQAIRLLAAYRAPSIEPTSLALTTLLEVAEALRPFVAILLGSASASGASHSRTPATKTK